MLVGTVLSGKMIPFRLRLFLRLGAGRPSAYMKWKVKVLYMF